MTPFLAQSSDDRLVESLNRYLAAQWPDLGAILEADRAVLLDPLAEALIRAAGAEALAQRRTDEAAFCKARADLLAQYRRSSTDGALATHARQHAADHPHRRLLEELQILREKDAELAAADFDDAALQSAMGRNLLSRLNDPSHRQLRALANGLTANALHHQAKLTKSPILFEEAALAYRHCARELGQTARIQRAEVHTQRAHALVNLGRLTKAPSAFRRAAAAYDSALRARDWANAPTSWATVQANLGISLQHLGESSANLGALRRAATAFRSSLGVPFHKHAPDDWAHVQHRLADVLLQIGEVSEEPHSIQEAIKACTMALRGRWRKATPDLCAETKVLLGNALELLAKLQGDSSGLKQAERVFIAAKQVLTRTRAPLAWATVENNIGNVLQELGGLTRDPDAFARSEAAYRAALRERRKDVAPEEWAATQTNLGLSLSSWGELTGNVAVLKRAEVAIRAALSAPRGTIAPLVRARAQANLGNVLGMLGEKSRDGRAFQRASKALERSLKTSSRYIDKTEWARTQHNLGLLLHRRATVCGDPNDFALAEKSFRAALSFRDAAHGDESRQNTARSLACLLVDAKRFEAAADVIEQALLLSWISVFNTVSNAARRSRTVQIVGDMCDLLSLCRLKQTEPDVVAAFKAAEAGRARLLVHALGLDPDISMAIPNSDARTQFERDIGRLNEIEILLKTGGRNRRAITNRLTRGLRDEAEQATQRIKALARRFGLTGSYPMSIDYSTCGATVPAGGSVILPVVTPAASFAFVMTSGNAQPSIIDLPGLTGKLLAARLTGAGGLLTEYLKLFHPHLSGNEGRTARDDTNWRQALASTMEWLWDAFCAPLDAHLRAEGLKDNAQIVLIAPGPMRLLPIHAARSRENGRRFIDGWTLSSAPSVRTLHLCKGRVDSRRADTNHLLAIINPASDPRLSWADLETPAFEGRHAGPARTILPRDKGESSVVLESLQQATHVHISAHGSFDWQRPERSYIQLADRRMTMASIGEVRTRPWRLFVLAACESGVTDILHNPGESIGFAAALIEAGAACVIASLWPVDDCAAFLLCTKFYELYLDRGCGEKLTPAEALREAQIWLRDLTCGNLRQTFHFLEGMDATMKRSIVSDRFRPVTDLTGRQNAKAKRTLMRMGPDDRRPFEHPIFWAPFVVTGA